MCVWFQVRGLDRGTASLDKIQGLQSYLEYGRDNLDTILAAGVNEHALHIVLGRRWVGVARIDAQLSLLDTEQGDAAIEVHV